MQLGRADNDVKQSYMKKKKPTQKTLLRKLWGEDAIFKFLFYALINFNPNMILLLTKGAGKKECFSVFLLYTETTLSFQHGK